MNATRDRQDNDPSRFASFHEFFPFYLQQHSDPICRRLHVVGTASALVLLASILVTNEWVLLWLVPVFGYGLAWIGHIFFERNRPATFK